MTVQRRKDNKLPSVFMHKIADIRGGVSVASSDLGNDFLFEGAVVGTPVNGICNVVKFAQVVADAGASDTAIKISKKNNFKIGNFVMAAIGAKAYAITAIDTTNSAYDVITLGTALGAITSGGFLIEAAAASTTTTSALKYTPFAVVGTGKLIISGQNIDTDAWVIGVTKGNPLPSCISSVLTGIINY